MSDIPKNYLPDELTPSDKKKQKEGILASRAAYPQKKYIQRPRIDSFTSKRSSHLDHVEQLYGIKQLKIDHVLEEKTGCSLDALKAILRKGMGAYYSSGARPNQTAHSWGMARLASALTGGGASVIDFKILEKGCNHRGIAYRLAVQAKADKANRRLNKSST